MRNAGKSPVWNQKICIRVNRKEQDFILAEVLDKESGNKYDMVGYGNFKLDCVSSGKEVDQEVTLAYKGKEAGWLQLTMRYIEDYKESLLIDEDTDEEDEKF